MEIRILTPANDQAHYFRTFIEALVEKFQPLQIYSLSQNISTEQYGGCFKAHGSDHNAHYCLLMVTETMTRVDHQVQDFANNYFRKGTITVVSHGRETIAEAIKANNRFFITVNTAAKLLYAANGYTNCDYNQFIPTQAGEKASKHFDHRITLAEGFMQGADECFNKQQYTICTFLLHQVVEQCCIALIRVQMAYRSEFHNLYRLLGICRCFSDQPYRLFLTGSQEDHRLFDLLVKSYSGARYASDFSVNDEDAKQLHKRVTAFVSLTKTMCTDTIHKLDAEAVSYQDAVMKLSLVG
jgi:HEPN domain-containing protein